MKATPWYIKFLLFFCKIEYRNGVDYMGFDFTIIFKRLFNRVYILNITDLHPPVHFNCRCVVVPIERAT